MSKKGFDAKIDLMETPNLNQIADKPLKTDNNSKKRVDINILKARAKATQDKENIKNTLVIIFFAIAIGAVGIYLSA
tara:strand:+ start:94 stop:324 length:231 start_codon:yes stop_codon:yes gene_type:complete